MSESKNKKPQAEFSFKSFKLLNIISDWRIISAFALLVALVGVAFFSNSFSSRIKLADAERFAQGSQNIVDTAISAGSFTSLVTAVQTAGLVDTLKSAGPFTVFAPSDSAFAKLPSATLQALLTDPSKKDQLADILKYHVVSGRFTAEQLSRLTSIRTVQGSTISINFNSAGATLNNNSKIVTTNIPASNGIIHVIDTVLMPPSGQTPPSPLIPPAPSDVTFQFATRKGKQGLNDWIAPANNWAPYNCSSTSSVDGVDVSKLTQYCEKAANLAKSYNQKIVYGFRGLYSFSNSSCVEFSAFAFFVNGSWQWRTFEGGNNEGTIVTSWKTIVDSGCPR